MLELERFVACVSGGVRNHGRASKLGGPTRKAGWKQGSGLVVTAGVATCIRFFLSSRVVIFPDGARFGFRQSIPWIRVEKMAEFWRFDGLDTTAAVVTLLARKTFCSAGVFVLALHWFSRSGVLDRKTFDLCFACHAGRN